MADTHNFTNITKPVFDRLVQGIISGIPGSSPPFLDAKSGTLRGRIQQEIERDNLSGPLTVDYMYSPNDNVLVVVYDKPFWQSSDEVNQWLYGAVQNAKSAVGAALFG